MVTSNERMHYLAAILKNAYPSLNIRYGYRNPIKTSNEATLCQLPQASTGNIYSSSFYQIISNVDLKTFDSRRSTITFNNISTTYDSTRNNYTNGVLASSGSETYIGYQPIVANTLNEQSLADHWSEKTGESNVESAPFPCGNGWTYIRKYPIPNVSTYRVAQLTYPEVGVNLYFNPAIVGTKAYTIQVDGNEAHPTNIKYDTFENIEADEKYYRLNNDNSRIFNTAKPESSGFFYMKWSSTTDTFSWDEKTVEQMKVRYGIGYAAIYGERLVITCPDNLAHILTFTSDGNATVAINGTNYTVTSGVNVLSLPANTVYTLSTTTTGVFVLSDISITKTLPEAPYFVQIVEDTFINNLHHYKIEARYV